MTNQIKFYPFQVTTISPATGGDPLPRPFPSTPSTSMNAARETTGAHRRGPRVADPPSVP
jgi:hypothetical protein